MSSKPAGTAGSSTNQDHTTIVLEYLVKRGYHGAASALRAEIDPANSANQGAVAGGRVISQETYEKRNLGGGAKKAAVREDPIPWKDGLLGLRAFVLGSLDIHRPELLPILLPVYIHSFIDLILLGYRDQAEVIYNHFVADYASTKPDIVNLLGSLKTPAQISESEAANRWRKERYVVRMTRRGWSLLLGWLQGGVQMQMVPSTVTATTSGSTSNQEVAERGREKMLGIINERVKVEVLDMKTAAAAGASLQDRLGEGGLESELSIQGPDGKATVPSASGAQQQVLKLGPMPTDPKLDKEVQRVLQADAKDAQGTSTNGSTDIDMRDASTSHPAKSSTTNQQTTLEPVSASDLPPYPPSFRTVDVKREVEKTREARKRIRLGPVAKESTNTDGSTAITTTMPGSSVTTGAKYNLPSVCMFTIHDSGDTLISTKFSDDSTLLAGGFSESYIRLWNLKGQPLNGIESDFDADSIHSTSDISKLRQKDGPTSRKLVGHSGPVYSLSFDPLPGPSGPPRYLLSSSQDATVRLWSMDTYTNIVAYRGHRDPVWDVEWGPRGVYFATASRDRTARLWTTERVAAVRVFAGHLSDVDCVKFHPNSLYLATGSSDRSCRLWDVQKGTCVRVFVGHGGPVTTIAMSPDGRYLASAAEDHAVNLWDLGSGRLVKSMTGHTARINTLSFSAESSVLVSGSSDCTLRVWDVLSSRKSAVSVEGNSSSSGALSAPGLGNQSDRISKNASTGEANDLLVTLPTKRTPIFDTKFTPRNLCLAAGPIF